MVSQSLYLEFVVEIHPIVNKYSTIISYCYKKLRFSSLFRVKV